MHERDANAAPHLEPETIAAYVDGRLSASDRKAANGHLAMCGECREDLAAVWAAVRTHAPTTHASSGEDPRRRSPWRRAAVGLASVAAVLVGVLAVPRFATEQPTHRDTPPEAPVRTVSPSGEIAALGEVVWRSVQDADRYRVLIFDADGRVIWESAVDDTIASAPPSLSLDAGSPYFWKVEARTGWDRWRSSELSEFTVGPTEGR